MSGNYKVRSVSGILFWAGILILLVSYFLPAFDARVVFSGYETVYIALIIPFEHFEGSFLSTAFYKMHMFLLGLHNALLIGSIILAKSLMAGRQKWLLIGISFSTINAIGFYFVNRFSINSGELYAGYYLWVFASLLIVAGLFSARFNLFKDSSLEKSDKNGI